MAEFKLQLPDEVMNDIQRIYTDADKIFGSMTKGADVVYHNTKMNAPASFRGSRIMGHLKVTKTYKTASDGGINTKVGFYGYFVNKKGKKTPAPLVAKVFEYGKSNFAKQPFFRKSFNRSQIYKAMIEQQKKASGGLLDE